MKKKQWRYGVGMVWLLSACGVAHAIPVTIKVLGTDDKPAANAEVWVWPLEDPFQVDAGEKKPVDANGQLALDLKAAEQADPFTEALPDFMAAASIVAPGYALQQSALKAGENIVRLQPSGVVRGWVKDEAGQPVAGAKVQVLMFRNSPNGDEEDANFATWVSIHEKLKPLFSAETDAQGQWQVNGAPLNALATVTLRDQRFAITSMPITVTKAETTPPPTQSTLKALPSATVTGRVVFEDGRPAANINVTATSSTPGTDMVSSATTDEKGEYRLQSLGPSSARLTVSDPKREWLAPAKTVSLMESQSIAAPDFVVQQGVVVTGRVVDEKSGEGIGGAYFMVQGPHSENDYRLTADRRSKPDGTFALRMLPGKNTLTVHISRNYITPRRGSWQEPIIVNVVKDKNPEPIEIKAEKGLILSGTAVDEAGKPAAGVVLSFTSKGNDWSEPNQSRTVRTAEAGKWQASGFKPGEYTVSATGKWDVSNPLKVTLPSTGPLHVMVKRLTLQKAAGRVVSSEGQPIAQARVQVQVSVKQHDTNYMSTREVTSDETGNWSLGALRPDTTISKVIVTKTGFRFMRGGEVKKDGETWQATDAILQPLSGRIVGTVLNEKGQPVAGVKVLSPEGEHNNVAISAPDGKFTLEQLLPGEVTLLAVHRDGAQSSRVRTGQDNLQIKLSATRLPAPSDIEWGSGIIDDAWQTSRGRQNFYSRSYVPAVLAPFDPDAAWKIIGDGDANRDDLRKNVIVELAESDARRAAEWAPGKLESIEKPVPRTVAALKLGRAVYQSHPELAQRLYTENQAVVETIKEDWQKNSLLQLLAQLGSELKAADASRWFDLALVQGRNKTEGMSDLGNLAMKMAEVNTDWAETALAEYAKSKRPQYSQEPGDYQAQIVQIVAKRNVGAAQKMLEPLSEKSSPRTDWRIGQARIAVIQALGPQKADVALSLARETTGHWKTVALAIAAKYQPRDVAPGILREAVEGTPSFVSLDYSGRIGAMAWQLDEKLGRQIFAQGLQRVQSLDENERRYSISSVAAFAFYYRLVDPVESRVIIEKEFARLLNTPVTEEDKWTHSHNLSALAVAMAPLDPERALQLSWLIPIDAQDGASFVTQCKIARYLMSDDITRQTASLAHWNRALQRSGYEEIEW